MKQCTINTLGTNAVFTTSAADTKGQYTEMETTLPVCAREQAQHLHPLQTIQLEPINGRLGIVLPDRRLLLMPGETFEIPMNIEHAFYNADKKAIKFKSKIAPALHTEWLVNQLVAAAKRKRSGFMSVIEHSYIIDQINGEYYYTGMPLFFQKLLKPLFVAVAKITGIDKKIKQVQ